MTTLKTISMFLRAAKTEAEEAGESTEGMANSVSELRSEILALTGGKVDVMIDADTFKSTTQILREISAVWNEMTDISQANLLEMLGGKRNANVVASLITNFGIVEEALVATGNAANSAVEENEKYLDSINGKVAVLKSSVQDLSVNLIDTELSKFAIDAATAFVDIVSSLAEINALLPITAVLISSAFAFKKGNAALGVFENAMGLIKNGTYKAPDIDVNKSKIDLLKASFEGLDAAQRKSVISAVLAATGTDEFSNALADNMKALGLTLDDVEKLSGANIALGDSFKFMLKSMVKDPFFWISAAVSLIPIIIDGIKWIDQINDRAIQAAEDIEAAYNDATKSVNNNLKTLRGLEDEFTRLSKGVGEYGNNISLSTSDYERYQEIVQTIVGISPSLVEGYDNEGNAIAKKNGLLEESIRLMEDEQRLRNQEYVNDKNIQTAGEGVVAKLKEHLKDNNPGNSESKKAFTQAFGNTLLGLSGNERNDFINALGIGDPMLFNYAPYAVGAEIAEKYYEELIRAFDSKKGDLRKYISVGDIETLEQLAVNYKEDIDAFNKEMDRISREFNPTLQIAATTADAYSDLTDAQKAFITSYINTKSITVNDDNFAEMRDSVIDLVDYIGENRNLQNTINLGMRLKSGTDENGEYLSVSEYSKQFEQLMADIESYDGETQLTINTALDIDTEGGLKKRLEEALSLAKSYFNPSIDEGDIDAFLSNMSVDDILLAYEIKAETGSLSIDEFSQKILEIGTDWSKTVDVLDFTSMTDGIGNIEDAISGLANAMAQLKNGTALTKEELAKLALQYPELLQVSDLFTNTTVENQKSMLDAVLGSYESEYAALVDTKIAELTATNELLEMQLELEDQKRQKVVEIADMQSNGKLDSEKDYQELIQQLQDLEGRNYVTYSDGVLAANEDMLNKMLENTGDQVEKSKSLWEAQGDIIISGFKQGAIGAITSIMNIGRSAGNFLKNLWTAVMDTGDFSNLLNGVDFTGGKTIPTEIKTVVEEKLQIDDTSVEEWSAEYEGLIEKRVQTIQDQMNKNLAIINNLTALKGLDLTSLYGSDSSGSSDSKVDEYIADIDEYREAMERLSRVQIDKNALSTELSNTDDLREQVRLHELLIDKYIEEQAAQKHLDELRKDTIANGVAALKQLGIDAEYNRELNQFYVKNLEDINNLTADSKGEYESLQEATNALRKDTETLVDTLTDLNKENQDGAESWTELGHSVDESKVAIVDALKEVVVQASEAIDSLQGVRDTLRNAAADYAANDGYLSIDTFQELVALGPQYMQYLQDENGLLVINEENIRAVIAAKTEQLALENALSYVERLRQAMAEGSVEDLENLLYATEKTADATWNLVYANLNALGLSDEQYDAALHNINAIRAMGESAADGIRTAAQTVADEMGNMKNGMDDILDYVKDMIKQQVEDEIDAIEKVTAAKNKALEKEKEALDIAKKEADYQERLADSSKKIAKLKADIAKLANDDSRAARVMEAELREELAEAEKEQTDIQEEYATDKRKESIDEMIDLNDSLAEEEIKTLENTISSEQKLHDKAIDYIEKNWDTLYEDLILWNYEYGSDLEDEITSAWDNCLKAAEKYGSYTAALKGIGSYEDGTGSGSNITLGTTGGMDRGHLTNAQSAGEIVRTMLKIGSKWSPSLSETESNRIHSDVAVEAEKLKKLGIVPEFDPASGVWYIKSDSNNPANAGKALIATYKDVYHTGGIAGGGTLRENEMIALLEKGEPIISNQNKDSLFELISFTQKLSKQLEIDNFINSFDRERKILTSGIQAASGNTVHFGDVYIYGANDDTVAKHKQVMRDMTNDMLRVLNIKQ